MRIRRFNESLNNEPEVGDYVIVSEPYLPGHVTGNAAADFLNNTIGQICYILSNNNYMEILYKNIPNDIIALFNIKTNKYVLLVNRNNIYHFSPNKEELEMILKARKFNL